MNLFQKFGWLVSILATALVTLWVAQTNHIKEEVSREEVNALVDAKTQQIADKMDIVLRQSQREDSTITVISEELKHFRVKATWYQVQ